MAAAMMEAGRGEPMSRKVFRRRAGRYVQSPAPDDRWPFRTC